MRPHQYWIAFLACLVVVLAGMGWVSAVAFRLDRFQTEAQQRAAFEENVRLSLWRMETALMPLLARESSRPYFVYSSFYPAERAYTRMFEEIRHQDVMMPSPLLAETAPDVVLHFQMDPEGNFTSPQVPAGKSRALSESAYSNSALIEVAGRHLEELRQRLNKNDLMAKLPARRSAPDSRPPVILAQAPIQQKEQNQPTIEQDEQSQMPQQILMVNASPAQQSARNLNEFNVRAQQQTKAQNKISKGPWQEQTIAQKEPAPSAIPAATIWEGVMTPLWIGDRLFLARRVTVGGKEYVQGCWLDWPSIKKDLMGEIGDLLPGAELVPVAPGTWDPAGRMLAGLPVKLVPGRMPGIVTSGIAPVHLSLIIAWCCVLLGAGAVGVLLVGAVSLSERRGAFVSAVTHELRTPLTTFRMYTEMLAEGMVTEESKRRHYLSTLSAEAERLSHLVENVLSYARLERGRRGGHPEEIAIVDVIGRMKDRFAQRAEQAGMNLIVEAIPEGQNAVRVDPSIAEQILFNLVDNASKYAAAATDKRIQIEVRWTDASAVIRVRDHGMGIDSDDARRLFKPFSKSAKKAAETAPGVGLGLALSRRLARQIGGDLRVDRSVTDGACFELVIPRARPQIG
jgi:anti-sigma regulatory factor (Ser/Thr protein kinase)